MFKHIVQNPITSLIGATAFLATWSPVLHEWLVKNQAHIGPVQVVGLLLTILGLVNNDPKKAGA